MKVEHFEDPNHCPPSSYMDKNFFSENQRKLFTQALTQAAQREGRKEEERRQKRQMEFKESLR